MSSSGIVEEKVRNLPTLPGVYMFKDGKGKVIYVGKAKVLRSRVRSYFQKSGDTRHTIKFLVSKARDIDFIVTANEQEALILEDTLLKRYRPRYNIRLKDDKTYVSIKITTGESFPRILVTRKIKDDGSRYFGPFTSAQKVRETVKFLRSIFPLRVCGPAEFNNRIRPCLDYQIGLCSGPAVGRISRADYRELVDEAIMFLEGRNQRLLRVLKKKMGWASEEMEFERAAAIRDQIASIEETLKEQKVVSRRKVDQDVFAYIVEGDLFLVQAMFIRDGRLVGGRDFSFGYMDIPIESLLSSFISQFYGRGNFIPDEVIVPVGVEDGDIIQKWLSAKKGRRVYLTSPVRGHKVKLLRMGEENAGEALRKRLKAADERHEAALEEVGKRLKLKGLPKVIEAFDISNIGGKIAVGAMVTFLDGRPEKSRYRLFKVRMDNGPDDYGMMREVVSRRYRTAEAGEVPDLLLVDGGKGQLNIVTGVLSELGLSVPAVAAIAKDKAAGRSGGLAEKSGEKVYMPGRKNPVILRRGSRPDNLLMRIRDEVHRFAVSYHRRLRSRAIGSILESIPGIGMQRRKALLARFGGIDAMKRASLEDLTSVKGISKGVASLIKEQISVE